MTFLFGLRQLASVVVLFHQFILDEAFLPELLSIPLSLLPWIIFDKYWSKAAMERIRSNTFMCVHFIHIFVHIILIYIFLYIVFIKYKLRYYTIFRTRKHASK